MRRPVITLAALAASLALAACGSSPGTAHRDGSTSYYASGYAFGQAADGSARSPEGEIMARYTGYGDTPAQACNAIATALGAAGIRASGWPGFTVPASEFPPARTSLAAAFVPGEQWVAGCTDGYQAGGPTP